MCGIFGYVGQQQAPPIVFNGLMTLEYRGYDSWGITFPTESNSFHIEKAVGKVRDCALKSNTKAFICIGHTRWATHGGVTDTNSHPHFDCHKQLAIVHNGIIENYQELKTDLLKKGHVFESDTDSEVVAHLLEDYTRNHSLVDAIRLVFPMLHGLNAIVALDRSVKELVAVKNGTPLVVGIGVDEYFIASDPAGIAPFTQKIVNLNDGEIVSLNSTIHIYSLTEEKELSPRVEQLNWSSEDVTRGEFPHFMLKEIFEQPRIIQSIADSMVDSVRSAIEIINGASDVFFLGCGTSYNAGHAASYLFSEIAKKHVYIAQASEYSRIAPFVTPESVLVALTQSGETIDVVEPVTRAKANGTKIIALVNVKGSTIYRQSDYQLLLNAGVEKAVASTKAYTAKLSLLSLMAFSSAAKEAVGQQALCESVREIQRLLQPESLATLKRIATLLVNKQSMYIIGRGISYPVALEGALKIKEVSYIHTEGLAGGELKHGTIALIEEGTPCIVLAPQDAHFESILSNAMEIKSRGGYVIGISSKPSPIFDEWIEVRDTGISVLTQTIPLQLLAYYLAVGKDLDPDMPRNLAKSVTVR